MSSNPFVLRCYAEKKDGLWIAACPQFTLATQGSSFEEAKGKLEGQIKSYIVEALTIDKAHAAQLLGRKAPARLWWRFKVLELVTTFRRRNINRHVRFFNEPALQYVGC